MDADYRNLDGQFDGAFYTPDGSRVEPQAGEWQCGECARIHVYPCQACCCLTHEECDCGQEEE